MPIVPISPVLTHNLFFPNTLRSFFPSTLAYSTFPTSYHIYIQLHVRTYSAFSIFPTQCWL